MCNKCMTCKNYDVFNAHHATMSLLGCLHSDIVDCGSKINSYGDHKLLSVPRDKSFFVVHLTAQNNAP